LAALRNFYDARNGPHEPFYFYDPYRPRRNSNSGSIAVGFPQASRPEKTETFGWNTPASTDEAVEGNRLEKGQA
jgi:hypothetical protein